MCVLQGRWWKRERVYSNVYPFEIAEERTQAQTKDLIEGAMEMGILLCNSEYHQSQWYIRRHIDIMSSFEISNRQVQCSRTPRSMRDRNVWKAHEWLVWLVYYSIPVLKGILPDNYLPLCLKLVRSISALLTDRIGSAEIDLAERLLQQF